jgi:hypothetical protein
VKKVVLVNRQLTIEFLSPTHQGLVHDKRIVDTTPYPLPHGSLLLQDLGFLAFTLEGVSIEMPTKKPRGGQLTPEQKAANQALARRRVAIEHVNSSIKRCRILKDVVVSCAKGCAISSWKSDVPCITFVFVCILGSLSQNRNKVYCPG